MAEKLLNGLQVAVGLVEHPLAGGVASLVHPLTAGLARGDDAGPLEAAVPPAVKAVDAHRLVSVLDAIDAIGRSFAFFRSCESHRGIVCRRQSRYSFGCAC